MGSSRHRWLLVLALLASACGDPQAEPDAGAPPDSGVRHDGVEPDDHVPTGDGPVVKREAAVPDGSRPSDATWPAVYPTTRTQSPITPYVAANLKAIAARDATRKERVFSKIGDSITKSTWFSACFAGSNVNLDGRTQLQPTISHFKLDLGGVTSWDRTSLCATVGWSASAAIKGSPSPLDQEVAAISPRFAVVMYGTNDAGFKDPFSFADSMVAIVDDLTGKGVIPILSSIPPRDDDATIDALWVPRYNAVIRAVAQARQIPLVDLHRELVSLPSHGLGSDGVHPNVYLSSGSARACDFTAAALKYGYNVRNLITLEALTRAKSVVVDHAAAPDPSGAPLQGDGSPGSPIVIGSLPFSDVRTTKGVAHRNIATYPGCSSTVNESGPELLYRMVVTQPTAIRAMVLDRGTVDIDVHLLGAAATGASCLKRDNKQIATTLQPGTYHFSLDTFVDTSGKELSGEYIFVVLKE
jgi:hypothetical protein